MSTEVKLRKQIVEAEAQARREARSVTHFANLAETWRAKAGQLAADLRIVAAALKTERRRTHKIGVLTAQARLAARQNPRYKAGMRRMRRSIGGRVYAAALRAQQDVIAELTVIDEVQDLSGVEMMPIEQV